MQKLKAEVLKGCGLVVLLALLAGCATSPKGSAYQTLAAVGLSVQKAMQSAAAGYRAGQLTETQWSNIALMHDRQFRPAYEAACDLAAYDYERFAPQDLLRIQAELLALIAELEGGAP